MFSIENIAVALGLKKPKKFAFLRNGVQPVVVHKGKPMVEDIPATAGNVITYLTPPKGKKWLIDRGSISIVCDATVANRFITLSVREGGAIQEHIGYAAAATASTTRNLSFGEAFHHNGGGLGDPSYGANYIGHKPIEITPDEELRIYISGGVAGDSYSGKVKITEVPL